MSKIKQEIDRAIQHYGDQATVFRVVRRALEDAQVDEIDVGTFQMNKIYYCRLDRGHRVIRHIRRRLPVKRPVTTERLKQAIDYSEGSQIMREALETNPDGFMKALKEYIENGE